MFYSYKNIYTLHLIYSVILLLSKENKYIPYVYFKNYWNIISSIAIYCFDNIAVSRFAKMSLFELLSFVFILVMNVQYTYKLYICFIYGKLNVLYWLN